MQKGSEKYVSKQLSLQGIDMDYDYPSQENIKSEVAGLKPTNGAYNHAVGLAGESLVRYLLHRWNYNIYAPDNPSTAIDFAIKAGDEWATIQVKSTDTQTGVHLKRESRGTGDNSRGVYYYSTGDFDYLFAVKFPKVYVIPFMSIKARSYVGFRDYEDYSYDLNDSVTYTEPPHLLGERNG